MSLFQTPPTRPLLEKFSARWAIAAFIFIAIVAVGIASRFWLIDMPNFKPIAALILLGGFFFRRAWVPVAALFLILAISDMQLGFYPWPLAVSVYASLALACGLGVWVKRSLDVNQSDGLMARVGTRQVGRFLLASLAMSTVFFVLTNGAVWAMGAWYPRTSDGLLACYMAGLPFYRATLLGDLFFTGVSVGGYCLVEQAVSRVSAAMQKSGSTNIGSVLN